MASQCLEARTGTTPLIEGREQRLDAPVAVLDDTSDEIVLGLEVVVHVAQRDAGSIGNLRQRRRHTLPVHQVARAGDKPFPLATPLCTV